jgi:predicted permease
MVDAEVEGYTPRPKESKTFYNSSVGPEYFQAIGARIVKGRAFTATDTAAATPVAVINETAARRFWDGRDPVLGHLRVTRPGKGGVDVYQVVGIVEDTLVRDLDERPAPYFYVPFSQTEAGGTLDAAHLFVRTQGDVSTLLPQIRSQLVAIGPAAPVYDVTTLDWHLRRLVMPQRMGTTLFGLFGALALALAAIGIYGVASYVATLRTRELGIRIALGADRARIRALVLRQGFIPIGLGIIAGLVLAAAGSRVAATFLRGVSARDPVSYLAGAALLAGVATLATWIPARRASGLDPVRALRAE